MGDVITLKEAKRIANKRFREIEKSIRNLQNAAATGDEKTALKNLFTALKAIILFADEKLIFSDNTGERQIYTGQNIGNKQLYHTDNNELVFSTALLSRKEIRGRITAVENNVPETALDDEIEFLNKVFADTEDNNDPSQDFEGGHAATDSTFHDDYEPPGM